MTVTVNEMPQVQTERVIGWVQGQQAGPTIIATGGVHGNEPSGVEALQHLVAELSSGAIPFRGNLLALNGNVAALKLQQRFIDADLNRMWLWKDETAELYYHDAGHEVEELKAIRRLIDETMAEQQGPFVFIDLHTTSADSIPFALIADTLNNRNFIQQMPCTTILGLEEELDGTLLSYINEMGHTAIGFEAGRHDDPACVQYHTSFMWLVMGIAGCIDRHTFEPYHNHEKVLEKAAGKYASSMFEVRYRHALLAHDSFTMNPGYHNFRRIDRFELLAQHNQRQVRARYRGFIFMPLYQSQGEDGFFIVKEVKSFWLSVSVWMRKRRGERLLLALPGVNKHPTLNNVLVVNTKVARWYSTQLFHLLGYRKKRRDGQYLFFKRRQEQPLG